MDPPPKKKITCGKTYIKTNINLIITFHANREVMPNTTNVKTHANQKNTA